MPSRGARSVTAIAAAALLTSVLSPVAAGETPAAGRPRPDGGPRVERTQGHDLLPRPLRGREALSRLDPAEIDVAAATNGLGVGRLRHLLSSDRAAWLGLDGRLFYVETGGVEAPSAASTAPTPTPPPSDTAATDAPGQTFKLHSLPGANRTIYLDFDGGLVADTWWNGQGLPATVVPPWTADADPSFSGAELDAIQQVWERTAEDYAPFGVDVTTEPPDPAAISQVGSGDTTYGLHLMVGKNDAAWLKFCNRTCGGVALVDTISEPDASDTSEYLRLGWVFTDALKAPDLPTRGKFFADAASHEAGHIIGLNHDGAGTAGYYAGTSLWGPIMGGPYLSAVTQWSKGEYPGANNLENDTDVIGTQLGVRTDEAGDTVASAVPRTTDTAYIGTRSDRDVFSLGRCNGAMTVTAQPAPSGPDLDLGLTLLDATGATVASSAPTTAPRAGSPPAATGLDAGISRTVGDGDYFVRVDGVGQGDATTGYTDYGSLGAYTLATTGCTSPGSTVPSAPSDLGARVSGTDLVVTWEPPVTDGGAGINGYQVRVDGGAWQDEQPSTRSTTLPGLGTARHAVEVRAVNSNGPGPAALAPTLPAAVGSLRATPDSPHRRALVAWTPPLDTGRSPVTAYRLYTFDAAGRQTGVRTWPDPSVTITGLTPGKTYRYGVSAVNAVGEGPVSRVTVTMPPVAPGAPTIGQPSPGSRGTPITAVVRWSPPRSNGGAAIDRYRIVLYQLNTAGAVASTTSVTVGVRTSAQVRLARGKRYRFAVQAHNRAGWGALSARSVAIRGR